MINIPKKFKEILGDNLSCETSVNQTIINVQPILADNKLVFFPEYTNHGEKHINSILLIAARIISDETYDLLGASDIEVLVDSILLHDLGMHISYEGFIYIIKNEEYSELNIYRDNSWGKLWDEYIKEAKKWDTEKIKDIFGECVRIEDVPKEEMYATKMHKLLIGEFLRRHHARLAYDIAIKGFPGNTEIIDCLCVSDDTLRKIVAHVSRSHGVDFWKMLDYIKEEYESPQMVSNVKLIYTMSLLRISDYFDMDKSRADKIIWNIHKLDSRLSKMEWEQHNCIEGVEFDYQEDKESLYIRLKEPSNSNMFLKISSFIKELQTELDTTWAVLGKVYTRYDNFKIRFRRVYSNIEKINADVPYVTKVVKFDVNRNILFSLAQPLYGSNPSYGIRELIQNASDACNERKAISKSDYNPKISIEIKDDEDRKYIIIEDNGFGMSEDVIINYFLVAGSSFREDTEWKNRFILDGEKLVIRNGKFGIGVIASFLLGEKIIVETRQIDQDKIYKFHASLDMKQIELMHRKSVDDVFGTKIIIETNESIISVLKQQWNNGWDKYNYIYTHRINDDSVPWFEWFKLDSFEYSIKVPMEWKKRNIKLLDLKQEHWHTFSTCDFEEVKWSYSNKNENYKLLCNGIIIPEAYRIRGYNFPREIRLPLISIIDRDGKLPLNLSRSGLEEHKLPFEKEFMQEMYNDLLDKLEIFEGLSYFDSDKFCVRQGYLDYPSIADAFGYSHVYGIRGEELIFNRAGYCLCYDYNLRRINDKYITKIWVEESIDLTNENLVSLIGENIVISQRDLPKSIDSYKNCIDMNYVQELGYLYQFTSQFFIIKRQKYDYLFEEGKSRMRSGFIDELEILSQNKDWICLGRKKLGLSIDVNELGELPGVHLMVNYRYDRVETKYEKYSDKLHEDLLNEILEKRYNDKVFIPYKDK